MRKARGCFIAIVVLFFLGLLALLCILSPNLNLSPSKSLLFLGIDEREGDSEFKGRTDTIMILNINRWGKQDVIISIPRDTRVYLEGHGWNKINAAYVYGEEEMIKQEIFELTGISIERTMVINFEGFKDIIDVLGGVEIVVEEPLHDPLSGSNFDPGVHHMDGEQALAFSRCRSTARADLDRMQRQQHLFRELIRQKTNFSIIPKLPQIISILDEKTKSNFSFLDYATVGFILMLSGGDLNLITIPVKPANIDGISYLIADVEEVKNFLKDYID